MLVLCTVRILGLALVNEMYSTRACWAGLIYLMLYDSLYMKFVDVICNERC